MEYLKIFSYVLEDNPLEDFLQTVDEAASPDSDPEQAAKAEFEEAVRRRKEVAEKDCTEVGLVEKSKPAAGTK